MKKQRHIAENTNKHKKTSSLIGEGVHIHASNGITLKATFRTHSTSRAKKGQQREVPRVRCVKWFCAGRLVNLRDNPSITLFVFCWCVYVRAMRQGGERRRKKETAREKKRESTRWIRKKEQERERLAWNLDFE